MITIGISYALPTPVQFSEQNAGLHTWNQYLLSFSEQSIIRTRRSLDNLPNSPNWSSIVHHQRSVESRRCLYWRAESEQSRTWPQWGLNPGSKRAGSVSNLSHSQNSISYAAHCFNGRTLLTVTLGPWYDCFVSLATDVVDLLTWVHVDVDSDAPPPK